MFSKKPAPQTRISAPRPVAGSSTFSVIGADVVIKGDIHASADLHVDGRVEGDIACAALVQGESSSVMGAIEAETARLAGHVIGSIHARDLVVLEASAEAVDAVVGSLVLEYVGSGEDEPLVGTGDLALIEAVVPDHAPVENRSAEGMSLPSRFGVHLLGIRRQGRRFRERVRRLQIKGGDVLLLLGPSAKLAETVSWMGVLPLADRGLSVVRREKAGLAVGSFALAIVLASLGLVYLPVALACVATLMVLGGVMIATFPLD